MNAELLIVGSELLSPFKMDTNSLWLTEQLNRLGIEVTAKSVIADNLELLTHAFELALERSQVVISTGGLGPTLDDLTRDALSQATGRELQLRPEIVEWIRQRFAKRGRVMSENNQRQAMIPEGGEILPNPDGTAPGIRLLHQGRKVVLLPGPPRELKPMFSEHVKNWLAGNDDCQKVLRRTLLVTGMGESDLDTLIGPIYSQYENPVTTINFTADSLEIHLMGRGSSEQEAEALIQELVDQIVPKLGSKCYSTQGEPLELVVGRQLAQAGLTVATAESLTGGLIGERLTRAPGASDYFLGGFLTYTDTMKTALLGVDPVLLADHGAVSQPVAEAMAVGARERSGANLTVSATGFAGPDGGTKADPVGTVYIGIASPDGVMARRVPLLGDRNLIRQRASQAALYLLRKSLHLGQLRR